MDVKKSSRPLWAVRVILTALLAGFLLWVWPGYLVHDEYISGTYSGNYEPAQLLPNTVVTQYFVPQMPHLEVIQLAVIFDDGNPAAAGEKVEFVLCEESGREIYSEEIPLGQMESGHYYDINVHQRVKVNQKYYWMLVSPAGEEACLQMMYTNHKEDQPPENTLFLVDDMELNGIAQTVSQYVYLSHPDKIIIIGGYWTGAVLVYIICMDIADRFLAGSGKKKASA